MLLSPAEGYVGQMSSYCDNVGESAGVPEDLLLSYLCGGFATLPFSLVECREFKLVAVTSWLVIGAVLSERCHRRAAPLI